MLARGVFTRAAMTASMTDSKTSSRMKLRDQGEMALIDGVKRHDADSKILTSRSTRSQATK